MKEVPDDFTIIHDGQVYRLLGARLDARRDGTPTWLLDWETDCPACGDEFVVVTPRRFHYPRRFCAACHEPGLTMKGWRRRLRDAGDEP